MKVVIIGAVAGGASCAARLRRLDQDVEIIIFERGPYASFANCGLPYYIGNVIKKRDNLLVAKPELFKDRFNADLRLNSEVIDIDLAKKSVKVKNLDSGESYSESYDKLVLSPGAAPIKPPFPGIDLPGIFTVRNIPDVDAITEHLNNGSVSRAVVVGGGFIGLEMAENLIHLGKEVTLIEKLPQIMPPLDAEMMTPVHKHIKNKGVHLLLDDGVSSFETGADGGLMVCTEKGQRFAADMVILAIGVRPEIALAKGMNIGERGGIRVDEYMKATPDVYAVGDAVEVQDWVTKEWTLIPLAGPANRQGRLVADNIIDGDTHTFRGVQGTAVVGVFDLTIASTGASEKSLQRAGIEYEKAYCHMPNHASYYPGSKMLHLKLLFAPSDGRVLGAQCVGHEGVEKRIDVIAMALQMKATVYDLEEAELSYAPQYGTAKDPVNIVGFIAVNHMRELATLTHWCDNQNGAFIIDVRTPKEYAKGHVDGVLNIPVDELTGRLGELPKDQEILPYCGIGQRSHIAVRILLQNGFKTRNLSGGYTSYKHQP
jgi:NADPH-dependent 2,4-dienoyl-CoA reductase/sulfur reductase-like enzyme/rhodanese-related sulfurtransferase